MPDDLWDRATEAAKREDKTVTDVVVAGLGRYADRVLGSVIDTTLEPGQVSLAPSRAEPPKVVRVATRPAAASLPFGKTCAKAAFHFEGKVCKFCGGDH